MPERRVITIRLRDLRRERAVTQEELADALGISRQSVNAMEAGRSMPSLPVALELAAFFGVPLQNVVDGGSDLRVHAFVEPEDAAEAVGIPVIRSLMRGLLDGEQAATSPLPAANLAVTQHEVRLRFSLPGFRKEDVQVDISEEYVTVSGESQEPEGDAVVTIHREFAPISFRRTLALPQPVSTEGATAEMKDGILSLIMLKRSEDRPKTARLEVR